MTPSKKSAGSASRTRRAVHAHAGAGSSRSTRFAKISVQRIPVEKIPLEEIQHLIGAADSSATPAKNGNAATSAGKAQSKIEPYSVPVPANGRSAGHAHGHR